MNTGDEEVVTESRGSRHYHWRRIAFSLIDRIMSAASNLVLIARAVHGEIRGQADERTGNCVYRQFDAGVYPYFAHHFRNEENLPMGHSLEWTNHMRNVFVEKWPSLVKCVLVAGAALFIFIHWA